MKKLFIYLFLFLFIISFVSAAKVTQIGEFTSGYTIKYPIQTTLKQNDDYKFHFHVFNSSSGDFINSSIICYLHLYNSSDSHLLTSSTSVVDDLFDYEFNVLGGNFSNIGEYSYIIQCEDTNGYGGFSSVEFFVTASGSTIDEANSNLINSSLYFFMMLSLLCFVAFLLSQNEKIQIKWTLFILGGVFALISINLISIGLSDALINRNVVSFFDSITAISFIMFYGAAVLLAVLWIMAFFNTILSRKRSLNESRFGGNF